jgi:hypothetical protein
VQLSSDGQLLAFATPEPLLPGDTNGTYDTYVAEYGAGGQPPPPPAAVNLAPDPGFETDPGPWYYGYGPGLFTWAADQAHTGTHALKLSSSTVELARWISFQRAIPARPGQTFDVSAWLKRQGITAGYLSVNFWDANGTYVPATVDTAHDGGTGDWTPVHLAVTAPAGAAYLRIELRLNGPGTLWADDLWVTAR